MVRRLPAASDVPFTIAPGLALRLGGETRRVRSDRFSRGCAGGITVELAADRGRIGVDVETRARIAANVRADDPWLTPAERRAVAMSPDPVTELGCRWVLKEALGKALGLGLALDPASVGFVDVDGRIVGDGVNIAGDGWSLLLFAHGVLLIGVAHQATPFAPAGKKPPAAPLDRYRMRST